MLRLVTSYREHGHKIVEQYFTVVLLVLQFYPVGYFGEFINFGLGTVKSERVNDGGRIKHCLSSIELITSTPSLVVVF